jgi:HPt (histidine-containing phosphotransfer) domain-containing protein
MIDWNRVRELQEEIGKAEFSEVVMMFLEEADDVLGRMRNDASPTSLGNDCHYLKGAALNLGFQTLAGLCQSAETRAAQGDCNADIGEMQRCYTASKEALLLGLGKLAA